jgi:hypothetical protein
MKDPYLKLQELSSELWNERKGLDWATKTQKHRIINKLDKLIKEIKALDFEKENQILKEINQIDKN